jgi:hypothetical protein
MKQAQEKKMRKISDIKDTTTLITKLSRICFQVA